MSGKPVKLKWAGFSFSIMKINYTKQPLRYSVQVNLLQSRELNIADAFFKNENPEA